MRMEYGRLLEEYATPFYIFDTDELECQIRKIRRALGENTKLCYAIKANPFIIKAAEPLVDHFEICSPGEFAICERAGVDMGKIILSGVYKDPLDIEYVVKTYGNQILYTAESAHQWMLLEELAEKYGLQLEVLLRLTSGNQFGMDKTVIYEILSSPSPLKVTGIHYFPGTQKKSAAKYQRELQMLKEFCLGLTAEYGIPIPQIEYGPGLPVCYFEEENNIEDTMLETLSAALQSFAYAGSITLEIGRFIAASCGTYVSTIVDKKVNQDTRYCIIDGGIHHVNYFGQMMAMKKPPVQQWKKEEGESQEWTICGSLCTANDVLVKQMPLIDVQIGDKLIFEKVGAYAVTEGISLLLSRDLPQVLLVSKEKGARLARNHVSTNTWNYEYLERRVL